MPHARRPLASRRPFASRTASRPARRLAALGAALALAACTSVPGAGVSVDYYNVRGTTAQQIDNEIRRLGPNDGHALAVARIRMIPDVAYDRTGGRCSFQRARVGVNAAVTLPRFIDRNRTDAQLQQAIDNLDEYARFHEAVHVAIANEYADRIAAALRQLPGQPTCDALDTQAAAISRALLKQHDGAQRKFDADEQRRLAALTS